MKMITNDTEAHELTHGHTRGVDHGWWIDLRTWGLGVAVTREVQSGNLWPNRATFSLNVGPLYWAASREWSTPA